MIDYSPFWFGVLVGIGIAFISLAILFGLKIAYSQDVDPAAYCLYNTYPFTELCNEQHINDIYNQLLERAREYNKNHMEYCNKYNNETLGCLQYNP